MQPEVFDRRRLAEHRRKAIIRAVPGADFLVDLAAEEIAQRLQTLSRRFATAVAIGGPTDALARAVAESGKADRVIRADLFAAGPAGRYPPELVIDDERVPFGPESVDLVVTGLGLQWVNDLPGALIQIRRALRPDGLLLASFVGGDSLTELRQSFLAAESEIRRGATPRVAPFADLRDIGALLQRAGFALPVTDLDRLTLRYASPFHLMKELKAMGAGNALTERSRAMTSPVLLQRAAEIYAENWSDPDGRIRATVVLLSASGWAPHESQQKPLRPGTARTRLADALNTSETKLES